MRTWESCSSQTLTSRTTYGGVKRQRRSRLRGLRPGDDRGTDQRTAQPATARRAGEGPGARPAGRPGRGVGRPVHRPPRPLARMLLDQIDELTARIGTVTELLYAASAALPPSPPPVRPVRSPRRWPPTRRPRRGSPPRLRSHQPGDELSRARRAVRKAVSSRPSNVTLVCSQGVEDALAVRHTARITVAQPTPRSARPHRPGDGSRVRHLSLI